MLLRHYLNTAVASLVLAAASAPAAQAGSVTPASTCETPGVTVTVAAPTVAAGQSLDYAYRLCYTSAPDRFEAQLFRVAADGSYDPAGTAQGASIAGQNSPVIGEGSTRQNVAGDYVIRVRYFAQGKVKAESVGEATFRVLSAPTIPTQPKGETPAPTPTPTPTPVPDKPTTVAGDPAPQVDPTPVPQGAARAKIALVKRAAHRTVRAGQNAKFTLTVRNTSAVTATGVTVCDALPKHTQYVKASRRVAFRGSQACVTVGSLRTGASVSFTITLRVDRTARAGRITNKGKATASNADAVKAQSTVNVPRSAPRAVKAPVTG